MELTQGGRQYEDVIHPREPAQSPSTLGRLTYARRGSHLGRIL